MSGRHLAVGGRGWQQPRVRLRFCILVRPSLGSLRLQQPRPVAGCLVVSHLLGAALPRLEKLRQYKICSEKCCHAIHTLKLQGDQQKLCSH